MNEQMMRVHAGDLAEIISDRQSALADLETCVRDATEADRQWREQLANAEKIYRSLRHAVGEALQLGVAVGHLSDEQLVSWVRIARSEAGDITALPGQVVPRRRVVPMGSPFVGGMTVADAASAAEEMSEAFKAAALSPWLAPSSAEPRCGESAGEGRVCDEAVPDGHCPEHGEVGPPTESMQPVEDPPEIEGFKIGRVFTRGDSFPDGITGWWGVADRVGDIYTFSHFNAAGDEVMTRDGDSMWAWADLLHMHGTVWEMLPLTRAAQDGVEAAPAVSETVADHDQ